MRLFVQATLFVAISFVSPLAASAASPGGCGLDKVETIGELQAILSKRAVDAVRWAATTSAKADPRLAELVSPLATFFSGGSDVGRLMGSGVDGLRALTKDMNPASYRYYGWDGLPTPIQNACAVHKVEVEFIDATASVAFPVTFTFQAGQIMAAAGWRRSLSIGRIDGNLN